MKIELSQDMINRGELKCPDNRKKIEYCDAGPNGVPGLLLELRASSPGKATWFLRYKNRDSRTSYIRLGNTQERSLSEARKIAREFRARIVLGADPRAETKARKDVLTYAAFFEQHYLPHVKLRKRSWDRDEELFRLRIAPAFGNKRLNAITRHQVQTFHSELAAQGLAPATANHHLKLLRQCLNLAIGWKMLEGENPAARIPMLHEDNRVEHYLDDAELERLLQVLRTDANRPVCAIAMFLLSTGCRLNEALSATWADVDVERRAFTIRATNSKSRKLRSVPLNDTALEVLKGLAAGAAERPLFLSSQTGKGFTTIAKVWSRLRKKAELPNLRLHDLRHCFASFLVNDGKSLYTVQAILGHSSSKVTERYAHLSTKTLQDAANSASARLNGVKPHG